MFTRTTWVDHKMAAENHMDRDSLPKLVCQTWSLNWFLLNNFVFVLVPGWGECCWRFIPNATVLYIFPCLFSHHFHNNIDLNNTLLEFGHVHVGMCASFCDLHLSSQMFVFGKSAKFSMEMSTPEVSGLQQKLWSLEFAGSKIDTNLSRENMFKSFCFPKLFLWWCQHRIIIQWSFYLFIY